MTDQELELYKLAIEARKTHYENFEKWMTFYYVAIGALMVAYYTTLDKGDCLSYALFFSAIGFIISVFWHLSCKGYKYWTDNWIRTIWFLEESYQPNAGKRVYSLFSRNVISDEKRNYKYPWRSANISTPAVTLLFSFFTCWVWCFLFLKNLQVFWNAYNGKCICCSLDVGIFSIAILALIVTYFSILIVMWLFPIRNNIDETHTAFELEREKEK